MVKAKHVKKEFKKSKFKKDGNPVKKEKNEIQELNRNGDLKGFSLSKEENLLEEHGNSKKKGKNKGGGFQSMGLCYPVLKGIIKRGYKVPTPIQRKVIPLILEGRDVVAMAKTGSGKTACFLIPLFEKLKRHTVNSGARALILSPTRELAIQTFKFIKEIGTFMELKSILVLGGDSMDSQFSAMHSSPDIIVATPGRFLHLCVEMNLKLSSIEYCVFDEADRLFEMGFGEQLNETLTRLPETKQMVMFSATLPKLLVTFAKAGLSDPVLIRLDVETKLPENLDLKFVSCRPDERYTALLVLLKFVIPELSQTVVFAGTQHHVELISYLLTKANISNTFVYSSLDPSARKINTAKFTTKKVSVLIVTDVAARGIDIPSLDFVVNLHFPGKPKLFIHRVGRCARAGRHGTAYSIFATDDQAHLIDLHLFLNRPFDINNYKEIGVIPSDILEEEHYMVAQWLNCGEISGMYRTSVNAYKQYIKTRPAASAESNKRVKMIQFNKLKPLEEALKQTRCRITNSVKDETVTGNQYFKDAEIKLNEDTKGDIIGEVAKQELINKMKTYRPNGTVFEMNSNRSTVQYEIMRAKREKDQNRIEKFKQKMEEFQNDENQVDDEDDEDMEVKQESSLPKSDEMEISHTFNQILASKKQIDADLLYTKSNFKKQKKKTHKRDEENYIRYNAADKHTEDGLAVNTFDRQAQSAEFSVAADNNEGMQMNKKLHKWDRIKKKMVSVQDVRQGKIRTESGLWIPATYKTGRYTDWKKKTKIDEQVQHDESLHENVRTHKSSYPMPRWERHNAKVEMKNRKGGLDKEMKRPEQIAKKRMRLETIKKKQMAGRLKNIEKKKKHLKKQKRKH